MITTHRLTAAVVLTLGILAFGPVQAEEQGLRPLPEDIATQADEMTEETMPFPKGSLQKAPDAPVDTMQDASLARFTSGDKDGNGSLSRAELEAIVDDDLAFAGLDANWDGSISREEWNAQQPQQAASAEDDE